MCLCTVQYYTLYFSDKSIWNYCLQFSRINKSLDVWCDVTFFFLVYTLHIKTGCQILTSSLLLCLEKFIDIHRLSKSESFSPWSALLCEIDAVSTEIYTALDEVGQVSLHSIYSYSFANDWTINHE